MNISLPVAQAETNTNSNKSSPPKMSWRVTIPRKYGFHLLRVLYVGALRCVGIPETKGRTVGGWTRRNMRWSDRMYYYYYYYEMNRKLRQRTIIEWFLWIPASSSHPDKLSGTCAEALSCDSQPVCGGVRELFAITLPTDTALIQDYVYEWQFPSPHSIHSLQ